MSVSLQFLVKNVSLFRQTVLSATSYAKVAYRLSLSSRNVYICQVANEGNEKSVIKNNKEAQSE